MKAYKSKWKHVKPSKAYERVWKCIIACSDFFDILPWVLRGFSWVVSVFSCVFNEFLEFKVLLWFFSTVGKLVSYTYGDILLMRVRTKPLKNPKNTEIARISRLLEADVNTCRCGSEAVGYFSSSVDRGRPQETWWLRWVAAAWRTLYYKSLPKSKKEIEYVNALQHF